MATRSLATKPSALLRLCHAGFPRHIETRFARPAFFKYIHRRSLASIAGCEQFSVLPKLNDRLPETRKPLAAKDKIQVYSDVSGSFVDVPNVWLRDHCHCSSCIHDITKQRLIETFDDIPEDIAIVQNGVSEVEDGYHVQWSDGHTSFYRKDWLASSGLKVQPRSVERLGQVELELWDGKSIAENPPSVDYEAIIAGDEGLKEWLYKIRKYGFSYVDNCPATPEASEALLLRIAFIRHTHYGGFYDFTSDLAKGDTAYTQLGIGPHTDNTYFTDPAGLQMFHLLSHTGSPGAGPAEGGASQLVDGFGAAAALRAAHPDAYETLATVPVAAHASGGEGLSVQPAAVAPAFAHDAQAGFLVQVRWNTADRAAVDAPMEDIGRWYDAARKWAKLLREREYWDQLQPGRPLIFDNWRVLHGRSAFTGNRRMCGGYINRDDFISRFKMLNWGRDEVLRQVSRG